MHVFAPVGVKVIKSQTPVVVLVCVSNFIIHTAVVHPKLKNWKLKDFFHTLVI